MTSPQLIVEALFAARLHGAEIAGDSLLVGTSWKPGASRWFPTREIRLYDLSSY